MVYCMANDNLQNEGYLAQQYNKAIAELDGIKAQSEEAFKEAEQYYPAVERAARNIELKLANSVKHAVQKIRDDARKKELFSSLSLRTLTKSGFATIVIWVLLIFVAPYFLKYILGRFLTYLVVFGIYVWLVRRAMTKAATKKTEGACQALLKLGTFKVSFMQFSEKESGDSNHPYIATVAPSNEGNGSTSNWRIDKRFGNMFGESFVVFEDLETKKIYALLHVQQNGEPQIIDITANLSQQEWTVREKFLKEFANQVKDDIKPIQEFAEHSQEAERHKQILSSLKKRISTLKDVMVNWSDVALEEETLDRILKLVDLFVSGRKPSPKGILLYGPPGTGKTLIARKLAKQADCHFEAVNIADLKAGHIGQTAPKVKELWQRCRDKAPTILFIDECESAFAKRGGIDNDSFGNELVQTFISEWDGFNQAAGQVFVIGATNRHDILDNAILSRFTTTVEIGLPNDKARANILKNEFKMAELNIEVTDELVTETSGMSGRDIHTLVATLVAENINSDLNIETLVAQVRKVRGKSSTQVKTLSWDDIVLPEKTLNEFQNLGKELRNSERLNKLGISTPKGILLYGPPGTGKTQIARVLAGQSGLSFIAAATSDLKANFIGQSGSKVKQLFEQARSQAPCIVFIDEIDIIAGSRGGNSDGFVQEIVGQLLQEIDGVATKAGQVFLLAASNHPENIDSALLSRLERKIEIGLPDVEARAKILSLLLSSKPVAFDVSEKVQELAKLTDGMSGRDLNSLITRATRKAVHRTIESGEEIESLQILEEDLIDAAESKQEA